MTGSVVDAGGERAVELDDVGRQAHHVREPGVAGAGVVDGDPGAAPAQGGDRGVDGGIAGGELVLGDLDHDAVEPLGQHGLDLGASSARTG